MTRRRWEDLTLLGAALIGVGLALRGVRHARRDLERLLIDGVNGSAWIAGMVSLSVERIRVVKRTIMVLAALLLTLSREHHTSLRILRIAAIVVMALDDWKSWIVARGRHAAERVERKRKQTPPGGP